MSTPYDPEALLRTALEGADTEADKAEVWIAYLEGGGQEQINRGVDEARQILQEGTPADLIRFMSKDVTARSAEAVKRFRDPKDRYRLDS